MTSVGRLMRVPAGPFARRLGWIGSLAAATVALHFGWLLLGVGRPTGTKVFSDLFGLVVPAAPGVVCIVAATHHEGRVRWTWRLMGLGLISWGIGNAIWASYELIGDRSVPYPGWADVAYLAFIPLVGAAVLCLPPAPDRTWRDRARTYLDTAVVGSALFFVSWHLLLRDLMGSAPGDLLELSVTLAYTFGDIALIGAVIVVAARGTDTSRHPVGLIWNGVLITAIADFIFGYLYMMKGTYASGALVDPLWTLGAVLIAVAAVRSSGVARSNAPTVVRVSAIARWLPYAGVVIVGPTLVVAEVTGTFDRVMFWTMFTFGLGLVVRLFVTVRENERLAMQLEQRVAERTSELGGLNEALRWANQRQEEFVSNATHELRTPLTVIGGSLESLETLELISGRAAAFVELARNGTRRMAQLVDDLLLASGLAIGIPFRDDVFDVEGHVQIALDTYGVTDRTQTWVSEPAYAIGDGEKFISALGHLLMNADQFRATGTAIRVSIDTTGDRVAILVANEGKALSPELREAVFDRFSQADGSMTRSHGGLGLGLYLAREMARMMNGDVHIEDTVTGFNVCMTLPAAAERDIPQRAPARVIPLSSRAS